MNYRTILHTLGNILILTGGLMVIPLLVGCYFQEHQQVNCFLITILLSVAAGLLLTRIKRKNEHILARDGFVIVALSWVVISIIGAFPFFLSGEIPNFIDAFFESSSGFTTTGASILTDVESMSRSMLFWRCQTNWLGGMGILVFMMAVLPLKGESTVHLLRAESTGPSVSKIVPKMRVSATILYAIYCLLSLLELIMLLAGGMPLFDSVTHTMATAGTGGFSIMNNSIGFYQSNYIRIVITVFMLLFGLNFSMYFLLFMRKFKEVLKNTEFRVYLFMIAFSIITITINISGMYNNTGDAVVDSAFTVATIISTTGFSTANYDLWPTYSKILLMFLMFVGSCAGSTAGGMKISRFIILFKSMYNDVRKLISPRTVKTLKIDNKIISQETINGIYSYMALYALLFAVSLFLISLNNFDMLTSISAIISSINNIGPGFAGIGPTCNFSGFSYLSKIVLSIDMIAGRLEILPIIILFFPRTWKKF